MIKTIIKLVLFAVVVLLLGQIRWDGGSLAQRFEQSIEKSLRRSGEAIQENRFVAKLARRFRSEEAPRVGKEARGPEGETLSDADRESLRRLLQ